MKKILIVLPIVAVVTLAIVWLQREKPLTVHFTAVDRGPVEALVANTRTGTIKACRRSRLSMPIGGVVDSLNVKEGDTVEAGQVLLTLWNNDRKANQARASAALGASEHAQAQACVNADQAEREYQRIRSLAKRNLASTEEAEAAETLARTRKLECAAAQDQVTAARAELALAQAQLDQTLLTAPFPGVVAEINGEIGEYVTPSPPGVATPPAVDLIDNHCLYVTAPIDEIDAARLKPGQPARITLDAFGDKVFSGKLVRIAPYVVELEKQARTVDVDVQFDAPPQDPPLLVGYSADVEIIQETRPAALRIPTVALLENRYVLVPDASGHTLERREVTTGIGNWHYIEVLSGLQEGDRVITSLGQKGVQAGAKVELVP